MMLTTKGRYAVMAIVDMALNSTGAPIILSDIAQRQHIALNYLEQIFAKLRKFGVVNSVRGPGGGYMLGNTAREITVERIIDAVEERIDMTRCRHRDKGCMPKNAKCRTHDLWEGLGSRIREYFAAISVQDIVDGGTFDALSRS